MVAETRGSGGGKVGHVYVFVKLQIFTCLVSEFKPTPLSPQCDCNLEDKEHHQPLQQGAVGHSEAVQPGLSDYP